MTAAPDSDRASLRSTAVVPSGLLAVLPARSALYVAPVSCEIGVTPRETRPPPGATAVTAPPALRAPPAA